MSSRCEGAGSSSIEAGCQLRPAGSRQRRSHRWSVRPARGLKMNVSRGSVGATLRAPRDQRSPRAPPDLAGDLEVFAVLIRDEPGSQASTRVPLARPVVTTSAHRHARRMRACTKCGDLKPLGAFPPVRRGKPEVQSWCRECFAEANARNYRKNREREKARLLSQVAARRAEVRAKIIEYLLTHPCVDCGDTDILVLEFDHVRDKVADVANYANSGRSWERVKAEIEKCEVRCANCHRLRTVLGRQQQRNVSAMSGRIPPRITPVQLQIESTLGIRTCRACGLSKPLTEFPFRSVQKQSRHRICLLCQRLCSRDWYARNRSKAIKAAGIRRQNAAAKLRQRVREYLLAHPCVDCGETRVELLDFDHLRDKAANVSALVNAGVSPETLGREIEKCEIRCANCHRRKTAAALRSYRFNWALRPGQGSNLRPALS